MEQCPSGKFYANGAWLACAVFVTNAVFLGCQEGLRCDR